MPAGGSVGLPGVGKTAIARRVADRLAAMFLRIETIEAAIASALVRSRTTRSATWSSTASPWISCAPDDRWWPTR
ncbi:AAA family ATPase [Jatrophihabitans lederbergiae]|uniref:AAA family ATPase n=1 Tax=Jatrophihabitans lederbergiae TaxID=3075547 RepID=UPI0037BED090